ncbi:MAG TPA: hypothetical protein VNR90_15820, partial [Vicinamibacterales bacterium]|nr:hypothetical protein [Vicinamibacterales bacterium]
QPEELAEHVMRHVDDARLGRARRQPRALVRLAILWLQLTQGNPRHKVSVVWWRLVRWPRYRAYLRA